MELSNVLICLNDIKRIGLIADYAIGGGYAYMYYDTPIATFDLDVFVILSSDEEYRRLYDYFRAKGAKIENVYIYIEDMPVQFFPSYIGALYHNAIKEANVLDFDGVESKIISLEYLILLFLTAFRPKDKIRIANLLGKANKGLLISLIKRFDDGKKSLYERYKKVLAGTS